MQNKLNNKGYMLVEIVVASVIALVMAYFLIDITIKLVNKNNDFYVESVLLTDKNIITKEIMDDINSKQLIKIEVKEDNIKLTLTFDDNTTKDLIVDNVSNTITYGQYKKAFSNKLNVEDIDINNNSENKILTISIPAYTNYSKEDYGIKITCSYNEKIEIIYPKPVKICLNNNNAPELTQGLIPVVYDETKSTWVTADVTNADNSWYDYCGKKWANAVLVNSTLRNKLQKSGGNYVPGQTIGDSLSDGVLVFYVWIPRYKYKVWDVNKISDLTVYDAQNEGVEIVFENNIETTGGISCTYNFNIDPNNGGIDLTTTTAETCVDAKSENEELKGYYTHPAFSFYDREISGFWFAKFESSLIEGESDFYSKRCSLPNSVSIQNIVAGDVQNYAKGMMDSNNIYGLSTNPKIIDSHVVKSMEWGAVAFLSHSVYGRCSNGECQQITRNNSEDFITGIANGTATYSTSTGRLASTTGTIYGIYDMVGGRSEELMANSSSSKIKYEFSASRSGYQHEDEYDTKEEIEKYLTTYAYVEFHNRTGTGYFLQREAAYNSGRLGDATSEIIISNKENGYFDTWQDATASFPYNTPSPWMYRGSNSIFSFYYSGNGYGTSKTGGSRLALIVFS